MSEDLKKRFKGEKKQLKNSFQKDNTRKNGVQRLCIRCTKQNQKNRKEQGDAYE